MCIFFFFAEKMNGRGASWNSSFPTSYCSSLLVVICYNCLWWAGAILSPLTPLLPQLTIILAGTGVHCMGLKAVRNEHHKGLAGFWAL